MSDDPWAPTVHLNNTQMPPGDDAITIVAPDGRLKTWALDELRDLAHSVLPAHFFVTDHGRHGPYRLEGVDLGAVIAAVWSEAWMHAEVLSADGYGVRVSRPEIEAAGQSGQPILLCTHSDGRPLSRAQGLVRLIVPSETDNALRQIKWVRQITLRERSGAAQPSALYPQLSPPPQKSQNTFTRQDAHQAIALHDRQLIDVRLFHLAHGVL